MKPLLVFITLALVALFTSCSTTQPSTDLILPELLYVSPLPPYPIPISTPTLRISLQIHVVKDGSVGDVMLKNSSGSAEWDSAALMAIRQWKYSPARSGDRPVNIWLHQTAVVKFAEPLYLTMAEILCNSIEEADSAYTMLEQGVEFEEIVSIYSVAPSRKTNGLIGTINIQCYPEQIKSMIIRLDREQFTRPIKFGEQYAIFKRLRD